MPAIRSALIVKSASVAWSTLSIRPLACNVVIAVQTVKALEEERPAAYGTTESIRIFIPLGFSSSPSITGELFARIAL